MASKLERLLRDIHPARTIDETYRRADEAVNSFRIATGRLKDRHEFRKLMTRLFVHIECSVLKIRPARNVHPSLDWSRCCAVLRRAYGAQGEYVAIQRALSGHEGGLFSVTRDLASNMAEEYAQTEISARVATYWDGLTVDERLEASREYLDLWGHLLPADVTEGGAARLRAFFPRFLEKHPSMVHSLSMVGRR